MHMNTFSHISVRSKRTLTLPRQPPCSKQSRPMRQQKRLTRVPCISYFSSRGIHNAVQNNKDTSKGCQLFCAYCIRCHPSVMFAPSPSLPLSPSPRLGIDWWTSLVPAPAVIPAPIAYINAAAVKKLVVGSRAQVVRYHGFS